MKNGIKRKRNNDPMPIARTGDDDTLDPSRLPPNTRRQMDEYEQEERRWVDSVIREQVLPWWLVRLADHNRAVQLLVEIFIGWYLRIERAQDTNFPGGNGFRKNYNYGYVITGNRVKIFRGKKIVAEKHFKLDITIK